AATTLYGLANCDSCRNARAWLDAHGIEHHFHDFRKDGLSSALLDHWLSELAWEELLNRRGSTWRGLPDADKARLGTAKVRKLMLAHPSLIKRPLLEVGAALVVGFSSAQYDVVFEGAD
ncbi:MAG: arsenate reductase, partial [Nevskiales bacterium]